MQVDNEEIEELSGRILKVIGEYMTEVAELNPSEIALALSLASHKLWEGEGPAEEGSDAPEAEPEPAPAPEPDPTPAPAPEPDPIPAPTPPTPVEEPSSDDEAIDSFLDE
jgi:hypothetical protein